MTTEDYYDEKSTTYDALFNMLYYRIYDTITWKYLEPYLPKSPGAVVLDAAGGTGRWTIRMAQTGCKVVLIDNSEGMLKAAAKKTKTEGLQDRIVMRKADITKTDYPDEAFDLVLCEHALFLFKNPTVLLKEFRRILKKQATLIISAQNRYFMSLSSISGKPSHDNLERACELLLNREHHCLSENGQVNVYTWTPDEFRTMLQEAGFRVEKIIGKVVTMPLRIRKETYARSDYPQDLYDKILEFELAMCERPDALGLAGHFQAIARKT